MNQFQKTPEERRMIKEAKQAYKSGDRTFLQDNPPERIEAANTKLKHITIGIAPEEYPLEDNDPVHMDYYYVAEINGKDGKLVKSDIKGTAKQLRNYLNKPPFVKGTDYVTAIRRCNMSYRNLFY